MTPDSSDETEAPKRRGRIPQSAWPGILARYQTGETLSAIAREFDCTPSAISYILKKAESMENGGDEVAARLPLTLPSPAMPVAGETPIHAALPVERPAAVAATVPVGLPAAGSASAMAAGGGAMAAAPAGSEETGGSSGPISLSASVTSSGGMRGGGPGREAGREFNRDLSRDSGREPGREPGRDGVRNGPREERRNFQRDRNDSLRRTRPAYNSGGYGEGENRGGGEGRSFESRGSEYRSTDYRNPESRGHDPRRGGDMRHGGESRSLEGRGGEGRAYGEGRGYEPRGLERGSSGPDRGAEGRNPDSRPLRMPAPRDRRMDTRPPQGEAPPPPAAEPVEDRLREHSQALLTAYLAWKEAPGEESAQTLRDGVHEVRKVMARIEIEMSANRREEGAMRPIPIPAHRAARRLAPALGNEDKGTGDGD